MTRLQEAFHLLRQIRERGITLGLLDRERVFVDWPEGGEPDESILSRVRLLKPELIKVLVAEQIADRPVIRIDGRADGRGGIQETFVFEDGWPLPEDRLRQPQPGRKSA
jgi:hypothetical protein